MTDLLEIFYDDTDMNRELTMVRGTDFCEMLALFFDLSEAVRNNYIKQLADREQLYSDYNKLLEKQSKKGKKGKNKKKVMTKKREKSVQESYMTIEENPKYINLFETNETL